MNAADDGAPGKRVTRDVEPAAVADLLEDPPRATLAFVRDGQIDAIAVRARYEDGVHFFAAPAGRADVAGREVVLVRDDGPYWFELRGASVRGIAAPAAGPGGRARAVEGDLAWYVITPTRVLAWDYGMLREA